MIGIWLIIILAIIALGFASFFWLQLKKTAVGEGSDEAEAKQLQFLHKAIDDGATAFLRQAYKIMGIFVIVFAIIIAVLIDDPTTATLHEGIPTALSFVLGALISMLCGFIGMKSATAGNVRTTMAAKKGLKEAFHVALNTGKIMGFSLVSIALLGIVILYFALRFFFPVLALAENNSIAMECLAGLGLGASFIALFARVGGGIFTKAADVGADLVGKVEAGIPEDDPRNPAVIADNVGDNVGDTAGMGADLFGSCAESTCAALVISAVAFATSLKAMMFPLLISATGIPVAIVTFLFARVKEEKDVAPALKRLLIISTVLMAVAVYFVAKWALPASFEINGVSYSGNSVYICFLCGLLAGLFIGVVTEYYTAHDFQPVRKLSKAAETGAATSIIFGLALGYYSTALPIIALGVSIFIPYTLVGMYGVAIASLGMLGVLIISLTVDCYGPVADNAGGIAEMAALDESVRERTDILDATGNTTASVGKGFAIGSAILTSLALFSAFVFRADVLMSEKGMGDLVGQLNLLNPYILVGLFIGSLLPFIFTAMTMNAVGYAAMDMIVEVRRQFREISGLLEGKATPDYAECVAISTKAALKKMAPPALMIIIVPILVGFFFGVLALTGVLLGSLLCGGVLALSAANAGAAWDNSKKYIEKGNLGGKGSDSHKAAVIGDTVGDPLKDTSGPSLNILLKLQAILSLVFVPFFITYGGILIK